MSAKNTTALLQKLRCLMTSASYVNPPVHAYLIPSGDAHQVCIYSFYVYRPFTGLASRLVFKIKTKTQKVEDQD